MIVVVVGHINYGDAQATLAAVTSLLHPQVEPVLQRWLTPLVELSRKLIVDPAHPEIFTRLIKNVSAQVNNIANQELVCKAWAEGRKNLCAHGLVYELETS